MKKLEDYLPRFEACRRAEPPFCRAKCPFHFDASGFVDKICKGADRAAYMAYRDAVCFPRIVSEICPAPCKDACPLDRAIDLPMLERTVTLQAADIPPNAYNIPSREGRVAIVGAGLAGLACALRLATRKYSVEVFEKSDHLGGPEIDGLGPDMREACLRDIEIQFSKENCEFHLNIEAPSTGEFAALGFDRVYDADGEGYEGVYALARGMSMAIVIDGWFKTGRFDEPKDESGTFALLHPLTTKVAQRRGAGGERCELPIPARCATHTKQRDRGRASQTPDSYAPYDAKDEAARCIRCRCNACDIFCDLIEYTRKTPARIREEVFATTLPGASEVKHLPAKRLMHLCTQCGACLETCPEDIDIGGLILAGRQQMHRYGKAPWAFHDFFLRDMEHADGDTARVALALWRDMPGAVPPDSGSQGEDAEYVSTSVHDAGTRYAFFPGCQIGAGAPDLVLNTYGSLRGLDPEIGMLLMCCGAPAEWAGDTERHAEALNLIRAEWGAIGSPTLLTACPACARELREYMPDVVTVSVYEWLAERMPGGVAADSHKRTPWAVFDPCPSRPGDGARAAVRTLARRAGLDIEYLPIQSEVARCCGYGGHPAVADPSFASIVARKRADESGLPYITWCFNCRDAFIKEGKEAKHILELLFGGDEMDSPLPTVSERRRNREYLKMAIRGKYGNDMNESDRRPMIKDGARVPAEDCDALESHTGGICAAYDFTLDIPDALLRKMDAERILEDDVYAVIDFTRRTGRRILDPETGVHSGYRKIGHMTYWVSYREPGGADGESALAVTDVYAHRMSIDMEQIWNGHKTREDFLHE
ncbi:MAG: NAD(P)-binding protein [Clostridiales Family XIII bacterium]|jgi:Fe-S oxidoreductase|nr:NAD(P)-binding protein [Clostridiales Family XIII bacterium]